MDARPSPLAGKWYPGDPDVLAQEVDTHLAAGVSRDSRGELIGVIAPHAGMRFSGPVAGHAFKPVVGRNFETVAVIGPSHYASSSPLLTCGHEVFETPLGGVPVDRERVDEVNDAIRSRLGFGLTPVRNDSEHSLEMELPFLQRALGDFMLVPIVIVEQSETICRAAGEALAECLRGRNALLVASSDLSHFHAQDVATRLDEEMLRRVGEFDPVAVLEAERRGVGYACGRGAIAASFWASRGLGGRSSEVLKRATSGDVTGDYSSVVGYGAAAIWGDSELSTDAGAPS